MAIFEQTETKAQSIYTTLETRQLVVKVDGVQYKVKVPDWYPVDLSEGACQAVLDRFGVAAVVANAIQQSMITLRKPLTLGIQGGEKGDKEPGAEVARVLEQASLAIPGKGTTPTQKTAKAMGGMTPEQVLASLKLAGIDLDALKAAQAQAEDGEE